MKTTKANQQCLCLEALGCSDCDTATDATQHQIVLAQGLKPPNGAQGHTSAHLICVICHQHWGLWNGCVPKLLILAVMGSTQFLSLGVTKHRLHSTPIVHALTVIPFAMSP